MVKPVWKEMEEYEFRQRYRGKIVSADYSNLGIQLFKWDKLARDLDVGNERELRELLGTKLVDVVGLNLPKDPTLKDIRKALPKIKKHNKQKMENWKKWKERTKRTNKPKMPASMTLQKSLTKTGGQMHFKNGGGKKKPKALSAKKTKKRIKKGSNNLMAFGVKLSNVKTLEDMMG